MDKFGLTGLRDLIEFLNNPNIELLESIKPYLIEIEFWALHKVFCNNMDSLLNEIPDYLLDKIFNQVPILKFEGNKEYYEYGLGIKSNARCTYREELKLIRNNLAHNNFTYDDKFIYINNSYYAKIDIKWFESLVLCLLANNHYLLKHKMSDITIISLVDEKRYNTSDINRLITDGKIKFLEITLEEDNAKKIIEEMNIKSINEDKLSFDLLKQSYLSTLSATLSKLPMRSNILNKYFNETIKYICSVYKNILSVKLLDVNIEKENIDNISYLKYKDALQVIINKITSNKSKVEKNIIDLKNIINIFNKLSKEEKLNEYDIFLLVESKEFLLNLYGYIAFIKNNNGKLNIDEDIKYSFKNAKNIWKEYLKRLEQSIEVLEKRGLDTNELERKRSMYIDRLNKLEKNELILIPSFFRNALVHDYVNIDSEDIYIYALEPTIKTYRINKDNKLTCKDFKRNGYSFISKMSIDRYLKLIDDLVSKNTIILKK